MSGYYSRVTHEPEKPKFIGLKKVSKAELTDIVSRLTKPTQSRQVEIIQPANAQGNDHLRFTVPSQTTASRVRPLYGCQLGHKDNNRKLTERELQRMFRRIQKPTRTYLLSKNYHRNELDLDSATSTISSRPTTAYERMKAFQHLRRPTTASRGKHATECHLCLDDERELNKTPTPFEYYYANDKTVKKEYVNVVVSRLTIPSGKSNTCCRLSPDYNNLYVQSAQLPLVSGLSRSKSVADIVNRLHTNKEVRRKIYHGHSTESTKLVSCANS